jgi:thiamine biosynthesis lipoprotein
MVEIGGDLRIAGVDAEGEGWLIAIRSPFEDRPWTRIRLAEGAVCTSGSYARYMEIGGRRYSHVLDPRTGWPAERSPSVTVIGPDAATADAWATALSVLGLAGLALADDRSELEALLVSGEPESPRGYATSGFLRLVQSSEVELLPAKGSGPGTLSPTSQPDRPSS